jgi:hypothetical protein
MKRPLVLVCLAMAALAWFALPSAVAATPPATLTGEHFFDITGGPSVVQCSNGGDFSFSASGLATGPYSGTFTETGTGHVDPPVSATVTAFSASFTVYSAAGDVLVTGTKSLDTTVPNGAACHNGSATGAINTPTTYGATIYTPTGNYRDEGASLVLVLFTDPTGTLLNEGFVSSLTAPVPLAPTDKEQCKHGGWQNYPQFKNQGDCVSFVATGGKNN